MGSYSAYKRSLMFIAAAVNQAGVLGKNMYKTILNSDFYIILSMLS